MRKKSYAIGLTVVTTVAMATVGLASMATAENSALSQQKAECEESAGAAEEKAVTSKLTYDNPNTDNEAIADHIIDLICGTEPGESIYMAAHMFAHTRISNALYEISKRDVDVQIIVDRGAETEKDPDVPGGGDHYQDDYGEYSKLADKWSANPQGNSWIRMCELSGVRACIGGGKDNREDALMHNKFLIFSKTNGTEKVVLQTSFNFKEGGSGTGMWNSAYTVADEPKVYDHYKEYFGHLTSVNKEDDFYNVLPPESLGKYKVYHSPRAKGNTLFDILDRVDCTKASDTGGTTPGHRPIVRVAVWANSGEVWDSTGTVLARKLKYMDDQGCYVDYIVNDIDHGAGGHDGPLEALLRKPKSEHHGPEVREFYAKSGEGGLHTKDILIDGYFDGKKNQKVVFTGTFNFTWKSVRVNDETQLQINDASIHDDYRYFFFELRDAAGLTWQTSKYER